MTLKIPCLCIFIHTMIRMEFFQLKYWKILCHMLFQVFQEQIKVKIRKKYLVDVNEKFKQERVILALVNTVFSKGCGPWYEGMVLLPLNVLFFIYPAVYGAFTYFTETEVFL